jgi:hypothetical protein
MADNFDLKKFLKENKALENLNPTIKSLNETSFSDRGNTQDYDSSAKERPDGTYDISNVMKETLKSKIKEYILSELSENEPDDYDPDPYDVPDYETENPEDIFGDDYLTFGPENELEEAKKKDEEEVEVTDTETEEVPAEEAPAAGGGLEDIAANMKGTENDLMKNLMDALSIAKGMGNEKLETQIGNTLKFFVSEYIGSGGQE